VKSRLNRARNSFAEIIAPALDWGRNRRSTTSQFLRPQAASEDRQTWGLFHRALPRLRPSGPLPWQRARGYPGTPPSGPGTVTRIVSWGP